MLLVQSSSTNMGKTEDQQECIMGTNKNLASVYWNEDEGFVGPWSIMFHIFISERLLLAETAHKPFLAFANLGLASTLRWEFLF